MAKKKRQEHYCRICGEYKTNEKFSGKLIGQTGLMKSTINGNEAVELGYILDNAYWHNDYGTEAARVYLEYAFGEVVQKTVCCSIRPENVASIRVGNDLVRQSYRHIQRKRNAALYI